MKKKGALVAAVLAAVSLAFFAGYFMAQHKYRKAEALRASVHASEVVGALLDLEHGKVDYARGILMVALDGDVLSMKASDDIALDAKDERFKLDKLKRIAQLRKKYPPTVTPATAEMEAEIDAYLAKKTQGN